MIILYITIVFTVYIHRSPKASITRPITDLGTKPAPFMAAFSSQGPNTINPEILKVNTNPQNSFGKFFY